MRGVDDNDDDVDKDENEHGKDDDDVKRDNCVNCSIKSSLHLFNVYRRQKIVLETVLLKLE